MKIIICWANKNKYFFSGLIVLLFVVAINLFPKGYVFGGGDTIQLIDASNSFQRLFYDWNGSAFMFYSFFYFLDKISISDTAQLSFYLGFFLFGSYISFYIFSRMIAQKISNFSRMLIALIYSLNLFTLFIFTGNTGFSYYPTLYIFIPALIGFFIKFIETDKFYYGIYFLIILFLGSSGFGNQAFALSFSLFLLALLFFLIVIRYIKLTKRKALNIFLLVVFSLLVNLYWMLPTSTFAQSRVEALYSENVLDYEDTITKNTTPISNIISLSNNSGNYFPDRFPYKFLLPIKNIFFVLSFIPIIIVFIGMIFFRRMENKKLFLSFAFLLFLFIMLAAKVRPPFEWINGFIFHIWGFNTLRGFDKTAIFIPFIITSLTLIFCNNIKNKKWINYLLVLALIIPLPFFVGKLQQNISYRFSSSGNYLKSSLSFLIKIPEEYYVVGDIVNNDLEKSSIATLPVSKNDGTIISDFPKLKFYGADISQNIYRKKLVEANDRTLFGGWYFAKDFNDSTNENQEWIIKLLGMTNSRFIIFHKDATKKYVEQSEPKIKRLESQGLIQKLEENEYLILYKIPDKFFIPYITWQRESIEIQTNSISIDNNFEKIKNDTQTANFKEINARKFEVDVDNINNHIILSEKFNPLWKAYAIDKNGKETEIKNHFLARGYANGWRIIPGETCDDSSYKVKSGKLSSCDDISHIVIEYYPIRLMWRGMAISLATVLLLISYLIHYYYVKRKLAKN